MQALPIPFPYSIIYGTTSDPNCPFGNDRLYLLAMWARPLYGARAPHPSIARIECGARDYSFKAVFDFRSFFVRY